MRKLILQEWISLDGFAAGPAENLDFMSSGELNTYSDGDQTALIEEFDTIILGANTYRLFSQYWPGVTTDEEVIADKLNATPKVVFSKTLDRAPWGKWPAAEIVREDAAANIRYRKQQAGKDMVLWGSIALAQSLIRANLIDEYQLRICPSVLGGGRPLFPNGKSLPDLTLKSTKIYPSGLILACYTP